MNYRDFFKNKKTTVKDVLRLLPEGVTKSEFKRAINIENKIVKDIFTSAKIASQNLSEDVNYYTKLHEAAGECTCGAQDGSEHRPHSDDCDVYKTEVEENLGDESDMAFDAEEPAQDAGNEYEENGGLPKVGGALAVPHIGQPIMMGKIIQVGGEFKGGQPASGEQSGMTNCGGVKVQPVNDKETITAGGKAVDTSIVSKSVGGEVVPGEGQKQGGPNSKGSIASTAKLNESKEKIRKHVKAVLKEIKYDKSSGKWIRINEDVNMKMGASHKTVQPRMYKVQADDHARTNQYEPTISEMFDEEEETRVNERYTSLANEPRNLSEAELSELKSLREKIEKIQTAKRNFGLSQGGIEPNLYETEANTTTMEMGPSYKVVQPTLAKTVNNNTARRNQFDPHLSESECDCGREDCKVCGPVNEAGGGAVQHSSYRTIKNGNLKQDPKERWANDLDEGESKVVKTIAKGQKSKKSTFQQSLKHHKPKKTTSGVHKRKL